MAAVEMLQERLYAEQKPVTLKWLVRHAALDVSEAIFELELFYKNRKGEKGLNAVYLLSGTTAGDTDSPVDVTTLVQDTDLERVRRIFTQLSSTHVYSLQCTVLPNLNSVYSIDVSDSEENQEEVVDDFSRFGISCPFAEDFIPSATGKAANIERSADVASSSTKQPNHASKPSETNKKDTKLPTAASKKIVSSKQAVTPKKAVNDGKKAANLKTMFTAMETKAAQRRTSPRKAVDSPKAKNETAVVDVRSKAKNDLDKTVEGETVVKKKRTSRRAILSDSDDEPTVNGTVNHKEDDVKSNRSTGQNSVKTASSWDSNRDLFSTGDSPNSSPVKQSPRRSPRKHNTPDPKISSSPPPRKKSKKRASQTSSTTKSDHGGKKRKDRLTALKASADNGDDNADSQISNDSARDMFADFEEEPTPKASKSKTNTTTATPSQTKVQKTVTQTAMDDEGFLVVDSVKTVVEEPVNENDVSVSSQMLSSFEKRVKTSARSTMKSPSKRKQATLNTFFGKR